MKRALLGTKSGAIGLVLRLALAVMLFPHGAQKLLGMWGGPGLSATLQGFPHMGIPVWLGWVVILTEFVGPILLFFGLLSRLAALAIGIEMIVAVAKVHWMNGFFMNWAGNQKGEGFEFHILAVAIALALVIGGGGALSIDSALAGGKRR